MTQLQRETRLYHLYEHDTSHDQNDAMSRLIRPSDINNIFYGHLSLQGSCQLLAKEWTPGWLPRTG